MKKKIKSKKRIIYIFSDDKNYIFAIWYKECIVPFRTWKIVCRNLQPNGKLIKECIKI